MMISNNYFYVLTYFMLCFALFNQSKCENFLDSYNCEKNGIKFNNNEVFALTFESKLQIDCKYTFIYPIECSNQMTTSFNKSLINCDDITLDFRHPEELESDRFKIKSSQFMNFNKLIKNIVIDISSVGEKNRGQYSIEIKVKKVNASNFVYYSGTNFTISINDLGNSSDLCLFGDQCFSNICRNQKCICSKESPVSHDGSCLKNSKLLQSCYVTEQCQFGGLNQIVCKDLNGNKSCQCLPEYILLESSQPKCLSPKQYNQSCEFSEECQSSDGNSFCSAHRRCQCIAKHSLHNNECVKTEVSNKTPYVVIFCTIGGLITSVIIGALFYKYYFIKRSKSKKENDLKQNSIQLQKLKEKSQNDSQKANKLLEISLTGKSYSKDDISVENDNIYDDVAEIRYVTNQKNAKSSYA